MSIKTKISMLLKDSIIKINNNLSNEKINVNMQDEYYYTDIALIVADKLYMNILDVANKIKNNINKSNVIKDIYIEENGIIKIKLLDEYFINYLNDIINAKDKFGNNNYGNNQNIYIEVCEEAIDAISLTNLQLIKACYLDNLFRILNCCGYNVKKSYYIKNPEEINNTELKRNLSDIRITINEYNNEQTLYNDSIIENIIDNLKNLNICYIKDEKIYLKNEKGNDIAIINHNGEYTDYIKDLAHYFSLNNNDKVISIDEIHKNIDMNLFDIDEKKYVLKTIVDNIDITQISKLNDDKNFIRYLLLLNNKYELINSKYQELKKIYSGLSLLIKESKNENIRIDYNDYNLINNISNFEDIIIESANKCEPKVILDYAEEIMLYININYLKTSKNITEKINIIKCAKIILENAFDLLGIILID